MHHVLPWPDVRPARWSTLSCTAGLVSVIIYIYVDYIFSYWTGIHINGQSIVCRPAGLLTPCKYTYSVWYLCVTGRVTGHGPYVCVREWVLVGCVSILCMFKQFSVGELRSYVICCSRVVSFYNKVSYMFTFNYDMATFHEFHYEEMSIGICWVHLPRMARSWHWQLVSSTWWVWVDE